MLNTLQILIGFLAALLIAVLAFRTRNLNCSGAIAAVVLGTVVFGFGGLGWAVLLVGFFISSSLLSRLFGVRKRSLNEKFSKGSSRDAGQVSANGAVGGAMVILHLLFPAAVWPWLAFAGTMAAVNADTWATELGVLNPTPPRLITSGKPVERGTSGGISLGGTLAALGGSAFIALLASFFWPGSQTNASVSAMLGRFAIISLAGLAGSLVDSLLGATIQAIYYCPACKKETERHPLHTCGTTTVLKRGLPWMDNDLVNLGCAAAGALFAAVVGAMLLTTPNLTSSTSLPKIDFSSPAFAYGQPIPQKFTCSGSSVSPALRWSGIPAGARSLALVVDDPDAPVGTFVHWVLYNLPPSLNGLPESTPPSAGTPGRNGAGGAAYTGPCPPPGKPHRYFFKLYALDLAPDLPGGLSESALMQSIQSHILAQGEWMGTFQR